MFCKPPVHKCNFAFLSSDNILRQFQYFRILRILEGNLRHINCSLMVRDHPFYEINICVAGQSPQLIRAAYLTTELIAWFVIVPLAFASLLTGVVQSIGTHWGLFQHYWVLAKLSLTGFVTVILMLQMKSISYLGDIAEKMDLNSAALLDARMSLIAHAGGGLLVLLIPTALSVYKPRGMTRYGRRKRQEEARTLSP